MRPLIFTAIAVSALVASVAIAQPAPPNGAPPPGGPGGPPPHEMDGPGGYGREFMHGRRMMPPPPKAAFFRFRKGDSSVTIKCADDEPTKACTDAATTMLQAINAAPAR